MSSVTVASHRDRAGAQRVAKIVYKPLSVATSAAAGVAAAKAVNLVRHRAGADGESDDRIGPLLVSAAVQGAVFATVKAATDRAGARVIEKVVVRLPERVLPGDDGKPDLEER